MLILSRQPYSIEPFLCSYSQSNYSIGLGLNDFDLGHVIIFYENFRVLDVWWLTFKYWFDWSRSGNRSSQLLTHCMPLADAVCCNVIAACNVIYVNSVDVESLTGAVAVTKAIERTFTGSRSLPRTTVVHFKVTSQGITLTDNKRRSVLTLLWRIFLQLFSLDRSVDNLAIMRQQHYHWFRQGYRTVLILCEKSELCCNTLFGKLRL